MMQPPSDKIFKVTETGNLRLLIDPFSVMSAEGTPFVYGGGFVDVTNNSSGFVVVDSGTGVASVTTDGSDTTKYYLAYVQASQGTSRIVQQFENGPYKQAGVDGGGTVTAVSVVTANGFSGTVATPNSTPAITINMADGTVTLSKMANMATASILGRSTAVTGSPEVLDAATARTVIGAVNIAGDTMTGALGIAAGAIATPGMFFAGDVDTGWYQAASNRIYGSCAGVNIIIFTSANIRILSGTAAAPALCFSAATGTGLSLNGTNVLGFSTAGAGRWNMNASGHLLAETDNSYDIGASGATRPRAIYVAGGVTVGSTTLLTSSVALTDGAAAQIGTLTNAPAAGNPTKWIPINDNGTTRYIPAW